MNWVTQSIFYHIYPLGFCGAPPQNDNGETVSRIEKLTEWIPHLNALGVNALYLGPVFESTAHGYDTRDYYAVDRRLGDKASFKRVCDQLHKNGIRIVLDGVFNHVGREFWAFRDVREHGQASRYCGWFQNLNFGGGSPMGDPFWYESWQGCYDLVKLNLKNSEVVDHLLGAVNMWMDEFGIDGLRLDAADCVDPEFFKRLRQFCKGKNPDFWLMGEIIHGDYNRWANPEMLDSVTNYECAKGLYSSHNDHNYFEIAHSLNRQSGPGGIYQNLCLYNFVDNHDVSRLLSVLKDPAHRYNIYTLLYTMPGVPSVYYGSEWGVKAQKQNGSDANLRPCLTLGQVPDADEALCAHLARLGKIRSAFPALQHGRYAQALVKNEQFAFCRADGGQKIYVALNCANHPEFVEFPVEVPALTDLFSGVTFETNDGNLKIELPACGARILVPAGDDRTLADLDEPADHAQKSLETPSRPAPGVVWLGRYRHFKGNEYEVLCVARHSETLEDYVVYRALYGEGGLWVRPASMFTETIERNGKCIPRFEYIGE